MKLLLTAAGVANDEIKDALIELLGKPIEESSALCIPTAGYGHPNSGPGEKAWQFVAGKSRLHMVDLGWKSMGLMELTALPGIRQEQWVPLVKSTDALLVNGGDALYLAHWVRESGLADLFPELENTVWVGLSAGSMVMAPKMGNDFIQWQPPSGEDKGLGLVDFSIGPHWAPDGGPGNSTEELESWAGSFPGVKYAIDDETAFKVVDGKVDIVGGRWRRFD